MGFGSQKQSPQNHPENPVFPKRHQEGKGWVLGIFLVLDSCLRVLRVAVKDPKLSD